MPITIARPRSARWALVALLASGCGSTAWTKGGGTAAQFDRDSARCKARAEAQSAHEGYAQGTPAQVGTVIVLDGIFTAIDRRESFNDCMIATGYKPAGPLITEPPSVPVNGRWVSKDGRFEMTMASEWVPDTAPTRAAAHQIRARDADGTTLVLVGGGDTGPDAQAVADRLRRQLAASVEDATTTPVGRVTIGSYEAARFELGRPGRRERERCLMTVVRTESWFVVLAGCTTDSKFMAQRDKIVAATESLKEIAR
jgi:hypothetical protein